MSRKPTSPMSSATRSCRSRAARSRPERWCAARRRPGSAPRMWPVWGVLGRP